MSEKIKILGIAGSLRKGSYNKSILRAALDLVPGDAELEIYDLDGMPLYNQDLENQYPAKVLEFKDKVKNTDALLIATPEYNYSIPGVLKNAIDCASRPYGTSPFAGKPVAVMGASIGMLGTGRAQYHLRQCFVFLDMHPINTPEVMVTFAADKIDQNGRVTDQKTLDTIKELLEALTAWARRLQG